jgi:hypothetical protein
MSRRTKNPEPRGNAASGLGMRTREERAGQTAQWPPPGKSIALRDGRGALVCIPADTRLADVAARLAAAGARGVSALDFPPGVRLGGLVFKLRRAGIGIETQRRKVEGDPFGMCIAVYHLTAALR